MGRDETVFVMGAAPPVERRVHPSTTGRVGRCGVVAALFALHPLHVESVAWAAERKDVLSTFFGMLTLALSMVFYGALVKSTALGGSDGFLDGPYLKEDLGGMAMGLGDVGPGISPKEHEHWHSFCQAGVDLPF